MKAVVFNLGCKVNQYESDTLMQELDKRGISVSSELEYADFYVINTCAVTAEAERKSRQAINRCLNYNPEAKVFIWGCAGEFSPESFIKPQVIHVSGAKNKHKILEKIDSIFKVETISSYDSHILQNTDRTRAYVKIQDGCNNFCSYCIIPYLRGQSRSRNVSDIISEVKTLATNYKEIVLTGINLMLFGKDIGTSLPNLIRSLQDVDVRIRLGSFYVEGITKELLDSLFSLRHFCPQFHLSLQSGDNDVLKAMNRHYTTEEYLEKVKLIRSYDANAAITTDIIVGYPTENEQMFENTVEFIKKAAFSDIHIFPFSARRGTKAYKLKTIEKYIIKDRAKKLSEIKKQLQKNYLEQNIATIQEVLFEDNNAKETSGYSPYYIRVYADSHKKTAKVKCKEIYKDGLKGEIIYE